MPQVEIVAWVGPPGLVRGLYRGEHALFNARYRRLLTGTAGVQ